MKWTRVGRQLKGLNSPQLQEEDGGLTVRNISWWRTEGGKCATTTLLLLGRTIKDEKGITRVATQ